MEASLKGGLIYGVNNIITEIYPIQLALITLFNKINGTDIIQSSVCRKASSIIYNEILACGLFQGALLEEGGQFEDIR